MSAPTTNAPALPLRQPTGRPAWPRLLLSGEEGARKSWTAALFSADPRCGGMWWLEVGDGENTADEYAAIPGVSYEIVDHDGSFGSIYRAVVALWGEAKRRELAGEAPVTLVTDSASSIYGMLVDGAQKIARRKLARQIAEDRKDGRDPAVAWDPETEVTITPDLWNRINSRWSMFMAKVLTWPGPAILIAREKLATPFVNGKPQEKAPKEWTLEGHKQLGFQCTAWVRMTRANPPEVVKLRSVRQGVATPVEGDNHRRRDFTVSALVYDWVGCENGLSAAPKHTELRGDDDAGVPVADQPSKDPAQQAQDDQVAAARRDHVASGARALLAAETAAQLEETAGKVAGSKVRDDDVPAAAIGQDDRDRLGLHESQRVTLRQLADACRGYLERHGVTVRAPEDAPAGATALTAGATVDATADGGQPAGDAFPEAPTCALPTYDGTECGAPLDPDGNCANEDEHDQHAIDDVAEREVLPPTMYDPDEPRADDAHAAWVRQERRHYREYGPGN